MNSGLWNPFAIMVLMGLALRAWTKMDWMACTVLGVLSGTVVYEFTDELLHLYRYLTLSL